MGNNIVKCTIYKYYYEQTEQHRPVLGQDWNQLSSECKLDSVTPCLLGLFYLLKQFLIQMIPR